MAARFQLEGEPVFGFSVEGITRMWPLERVLREGRVRAGSAYATTTVGQLRRAGCDVLASFGDHPPHFTVRAGEPAAINAVAALLQGQVRRNPAWEGRP